MSALLALRSDRNADRHGARSALAAAYWKPVYKYTRARWGRPADEAEDLTQEFFLHVLDHDTFASFDPGKARFRTFLRTCLDRFLTDEGRRRGARKRGGDARVLSLDADFAAAERELAATRGATDPEELFDTEWVRHIAALAVERLRAELGRKGKAEHLTAFELAHLEPAASSEPPSYAELAERLGISVTDVTNRLSYARRSFRRIALDLLREITASEEELRDEARAVFGISL
jgi:RNA polymerase sigma factor (sigma-70 family)